MNRTQFLELFEAGLSDCGIDAETRAPFVLHAKQKIDSVDDDVFTARDYTAVDAHKLASAVATEGNDATDEFFKLILPKRGTVKILTVPLLTPLAPFWREQRPCGKQ